MALKLFNEEAVNQSGGTSISPGLIAIAIMLFVGAVVGGLSVGIYTWHPGWGFGVFGVGIVSWFAFLALATYLDNKQKEKEHLL